jgi:hypothetical protein
MKKIILLLLSTWVFNIQAVEVIEGDSIKSTYKSNKDNVIALIQKRKTFYLKEKGNDKLQRKPAEVRVKAGEVIYIVNSEKKITHNIYDESDKSWILTAQGPGDVASVIFKEKGAHNLKCAIHPKMKIKVIIE